jgi:hypothetical protein
MWVNLMESPWEKTMVFILATYSELIHSSYFDEWGGKSELNFEFSPTTSKYSILTLGMIFILGTVLCFYPSLIPFILAGIL